MLSILMVGDVMLGRLVNEVMKHPFNDEHYQYARKIIASHRGIKLSEGVCVDWEYPWGNTIPLFKMADCRIINLETSVTTHSEKWPDKKFNYRMHPGNIEALKAAKIDYCSLSNNHILDYEIPGMLETVATLDKAGIQHAGAGKNHEEVIRPAIVEVRGRKLAVFSFSDHGVCVSKDGYHDLWAAEKDHPGFNFINIDMYNFDQDPLQLRKVLQTPKWSKKADVVIFSVHWGPNYSWMPSSAIKKFAHWLVDECGVDIIHGHSSHHIQGIEIYRNRPIIYGCGDFIDDYAVDEHFRNDNGIAYMLNLDSETLKVSSVHLYPTVIEAFQAKRAEGKSYRWITSKMSHLCELLGTKVQENKVERRMEIMLSTPIMRQAF